MKWRVLILCVFGSCYILQGIIWAGEYLDLWRWGQAKTFAGANDNAQSRALLTFAEDAKVNRHLEAVGHDINGWQTFKWVPPIAREYDKKAN